MGEPQAGVEGTYIHGYAPGIVRTDYSSSSVRS